MRRFGSEDFPGGKRGRLKRNYRSTPEIVDVCSAFARQMSAGGDDSALDATAPAIGPQPEFRTVTTRGPAAGGPGGRDPRDGGSRLCLRDQAVLCTGNEKLSDNRAGARAARHSGAVSRQPVRACRSQGSAGVPSLLVDRRAMGLLRIACWPEFEMSMADVAALLGALREDKWRAVAGCGIPLP